LKGAIIFAVLATLLATQVSALIINEVMANTEDDTYNEWIELYNEDNFNVDVSGYVIGDYNDNDTIRGGLYDYQGTVIPPNGYAILTDDATRVYNNFETSPYAVRLYIDDASIGNGLRNSDDTLYLYYGNQLIDQVSYTYTEKGKSNALLNSVWNIANPTPGYSNNGSILYATAGCDWIIEILSDEVFDSGDTFTFRVKATKLFGNSTLLSGTVVIEDLFGNEVKSYSPWTNEQSTYHKTSNTWTPNLEDGRSYLIKSDILVTCDESNYENNHAEKLISIRGSPIDEESSIKIEKIYDLGSDGKAEFGQIIKVKLNVYRGKTTKDSVKLWVEGDDVVSKLSKTNVYTRYTDYSLTIPIQIYPNCDYDYEDGDYEIYAEGLDVRDEEEIEIEGITESLCDKENKGTFSYNLDAPSEIYTGNEFDVEVKITNNDRISHSFDVWSYIYRGSKCYSGDREENKKNVVIESGDIDIIKLSNTVNEADQGNYNLKVKIKRDDQKTVKELTGAVVVKSGINEQTKDLVPIIQTNSQVKTFKTPVTIYESTNIKAKELTLYFILIMAVLLDIALIIKR
jgi:hypothetical protein